MAQETPDQKRCKNCKCRPLVELPVDKFKEREWVSKYSDVQFVFPFFYEREETDPIK